MRKLVPWILTLTGALLASNAYSATYPGQACEGRWGQTLNYSSTGASNATSNTISITCPTVRLKDGGTAAATAVVYFVDDGKSKTCFFDNFNIDTGGLWKWTSASGTRRLVLNPINPTKSWSPFAINCSLPASSQITGYYLAE